MTGVNLKHMILNLINKKKRKSELISLKKIKIKQTMQLISKNFLQ